MAKSLYVTDSDNGQGLENGTFIIMKRMEPCTWGARTALESTHTTP